MLDIDCVQWFLSIQRGISYFCLVAFFQGNTNKPMKNNCTETSILGNYGVLRVYVFVLCVGFCHGAVKLVISTLFSFFEHLFNFCSKAGHNNYALRLRSWFFKALLVVFTPIIFSRQYLRIFKQIYIFSHTKESYLSAVRHNNC